MISHRESVRSLSKKVEKMLNRCDLDGGLRAIRSFVERIITEPLCTAQALGSETLDALCQRIGAKNFEKLLAMGVVQHKQIAERPSIVYIVTRLQISGGHTRVIEELIRSQPDAEHLVLSTELGGKSDSVYLNGGQIQSEAINRVEFAPYGSYLTRLSWLQKRLMECHPTKTYLFNNHQDSVAVAAIQPKMELDAWFYHHGNHHLSLGIYLKHLVHIDCHPAGFHYCRDTLGINNRYFPLTVEDRGKRTHEFMHNGTLTTCTAARANKIESPYFIHYVDLVPQLLNTTSGTHIHIGRLTPWTLWRIRRTLNRYRIKKERFVYIPWVQSVWRALCDFKVDLYIASFPYGGGLTSVEAMGAGIPIALHQHISSRLLGGTDLGYPKSLNWRYPEDLIESCRELTLADLETRSRAARLQYEKFHSPLHFKEALKEDGSSIPALTDDTFSIAYDEWAAWMENQVSIGHVLYKALYRVGRSVRFRRVFF